MGLVKTSSTMTEKLEITISPEEQEIHQLEQRVKMLLSRIEKLIDQSSSYPSKCLGDILITFKGMFIVWEDIPGRENIRNIITNNLEIFQSKIPRIEKYFELIEQYPEFKEKELANMKGAFPDLYEQASKEKMETGKHDIRSRSEIYIDKAWERLKDHTHKEQGT